MMRAGRSASLVPIDHGSGPRFVAWIVVWTGLGAWRMATRDA